MGSTVIDEKFCIALSGRKGVPPQLEKNALLAPNPKLGKKTPLHASDETLTGFVNTTEIADFRVGSTVIDEKFCMALSGRKGVPPQLEKNALLAPNRPN